MGIDKQSRLAQLAASRGPLEHQQFAAEIEVEVKEAGVKHAGTGVDQDQVEAAKANLEGINAQIKVIDDRAEKVKLEDDDDA